MKSNILCKIASQMDFEKLCLGWRDIDYGTFSQQKSLYPYQIEALQYATKILYKFYHRFSSTEYSKKEFLKLNEQNGLHKEFQKRFTYSDRESVAYGILSEYFEEDDLKLPAWNFINRMGFWMATGSGKSIVLIKLIELLQNLMNNELLPDNRILFLTHRPDLIEQLKRHIGEFNAYMKIEKGIEFVVRNLREFPDQEVNGNLFKDTQINIYFYRSDLISDLQKENIINFKNYDNEGNWFIILDEAHKGGSEESKRKQYYNVLSRNGFLFNFSATFTDEIDILSTVYNLNLAEYIKKGYGKHVYLFQEQFKNFKTTEDNKDFEESEKQKIVLMSVIMLVFVKKQAEQIRNELGTEYFHNPLLLTLVNSVSAKDSDLYLFFRELEKIAKKDIDDKLFSDAKSTLQNDLHTRKYAEFEGIDLLFDSDEIETIKNITLDEILKYVFNSNTSGHFEVRKNPKNKQELSFRVKSGAHSDPFALIKIGDIKAFEKNNLEHYSIEEEFDDVSLFENIDDSSVNILMGSRAFYEGWDSNRPNIINFVNIGTHRDAKKFILQSVGRGIRIEPIKNQQKRLSFLINNEMIKDERLKEKKVNRLETLFVFGTNRNAILSVLETLKGEQPEEEHRLSLFEKEDFVQPLLIPVYKNVSSSSKRRLKRLRINKDDFVLYKNIVETMDATTIALSFNISFEEVDILIEKQKDDVKNFDRVFNEKIGKEKLVIKHILNYYKIIPEEVDTFSTVKEEITHYNKISVTTSEVGSETSIKFERLEELKSKIKRLKSPIKYKAAEAKLKEKLAKGEMDIDQYTKKVIKSLEETNSGTETFEHRSDEIKIKKLLNHYYFPMIISSKDRIQWMKHIIDVPSEIKFINALEEHLKKKDNFFSQFGWWKFSKIDHSLDKNVRIPYIDPSHGKRNFLPDFIFWLKKEKEYHILYVDPKGTGRTEYKHKVDGYRDLFVEKEKVKEFSFGKDKVKVHLRLVTEDTAVFGKDDFYQKYWIEPDKFDIELE